MPTPDTTFEIRAVDGVSVAVLVQPGTTRRWPEGHVIGFAQKY